MKIIEPITVTDSVLTSSTIAEDDYAAWSGATAYSIGDKRVYAHKVYEALAANTNKQPDQSPLDWLNLGATNRWKMFDEKVGTQSTATTSMTVTLTPGPANSIALINVDGSYADIVMTDTLAGVVYSRTINLTGTILSADWYSYFTDPVTARTFLVVTDIPLYPFASIAVTVRKAAGEAVKLGALVVGISRQWGIKRAILYGATVGIQDYSRKERDEFGNFLIVERAFAKRARWGLILGRNEIDSFQSRMAAIRAKPAVFIGNDKFDSTIIYGFYRGFDVVISSLRHAECSIEIEGLI